MKGPGSALAPVRSVGRDGLRAIDIVGIVLLLVVGAFALISGVANDVPAIAVMGAGSLGVFLVGGASVVLQMRVVTPPAPTLSVVGGRPATVLRREPVAFTLGLVVMAVLGATCLGWAILAVGSSIPLAVILGALGLWLFVPLLLAACGRFNAGVLLLTPDGLDYRSRGLTLSIGWDEIAAVSSERPMGVMVLSRGGQAITHSRTAGWFTGEKLIKADSAVLRTDAMAIDKSQLAPVLWRYVMTPTARAELGTPASLPQSPTPPR
ncbi:hypothetical protein SAMN05216410_0393 [Sanguibacter gelidistatuariae]|uniref:PH domain-containing protein n=1 Tax=Sanguibacter gelidistatuariae TaxID=1814289 RepID=A0A1G6GR83_9MICO|nr:hypothetical protein [Sanguibacter gelidistatuariae]SDB84458.1 hypothetical protein SAMN05216410_0393 [Sanguibacter gelidistatuariae]